MLTLNIESNRELREGDRVVVKYGEKRGTHAQVVGFDLSEADTPIVIQYPISENGERELVGANDVEYLGRFQEAPDTLEPLPEIPTVLTEGAHWTAGKILCMKLSEDGSTLSFVPKDDSVRLADILGEADGSAALGKLFEAAFVTRRPHLVQIGESKQIMHLLGSVSPMEAALHLTA